MKQQSSLSRRDFLRMSAATATGLVFAACTPIDSSAPTPSDGGVSAAQQEVIVWWGSGVDLEEKLEQNPDNTDAQWAKWLIETFEERFPDIKVVSEDHGWDEPLRTGLLTAIAGGNPPDVTIGEAFVYEFARLCAFKAGEINQTDLP